MNIFEEAIKSQLRFDFNGSTTVEQLYNARKTKEFKQSLIDYEDQLTQAIEKYGKSSRRSSNVKTNEQKLQELRLALVTNLIDEILAAEEDAKNASIKKEQRDLLLSLKAQKQNEALSQLSLDDIDKKLAEL